MRCCRTAFWESERPVARARHSTAVIAGLTRQSMPMPDRLVRAAKWTRESSPRVTLGEWRGTKAYWKYRSLMTLRVFVVR